MSAALAIVQPNQLAGPDLAERRRLLQNVIMRNGTQAQVDLVMSICNRYGLDPLLKHLVLIKDVPYITRDGLMHIAHQSGQLNGIAVELRREADGEWSATCTVHRKDMKLPIAYTVYQKEHQPAQTGQSAWAKFPRAMLAKCFDEETEVLTTRGFERFGAVWGQVLQVTDRGLEATDAIPFVQNYEGPMVTLDSDDLNFCVTPNHDMLTTEGKIEAGDLYQRARSRTVVRIPRLVAGSREAWSISDQCIELAAAYLTDGSDASFGRFTVGVSRQRKIAHLESLGGWHARETDRVAGKSVVAAGRTITTRADQERFIYHRSLVSALCGPNKTIRTEVLLQFSRDQARRFVDAMLFHDGHRQRHSGVRRFYSSREDHIEAFELAACIAGYSVSDRKQRDSDIGTKPNFYVTISERDNIAVRRIGRAYLDKPGRQTTEGLHLAPNTSGRVWCVTVPSGVIVVRRRGFSMLCGNCAEVACLRRAFDVSLGAVEEVGYDGHNPETTIGQVVEIAEGEAVAAAAPVAAPKVQDWPDAQLLEELRYELSEAQERRIVEVYIGRGTDKPSLAMRLEAVKQAGVPKKLANEIALARATALGIPPKSAPADAPLTEVVGEPEHSGKAQKITEIRALARLTGYDEARLAGIAIGMYRTDDLTRWSEDQLDSLIAWFAEESKAVVGR